MEKPRTGLRLASFQGEEGAAVKPPRKWPEPRPGGGAGEEQAHQCAVCAKPVASTLADCVHCGRSLEPRCCWSLWPGPPSRRGSGLPEAAGRRAAWPAPPFPWCPGLLGSGLRSFRRRTPSSTCAPRFSLTLNPRSRFSFLKFLCSSLPTFSSILPGLGMDLQPPFLPRFSNAGISARPVFCRGISPEHGLTERSRYWECNGCCVRTLEMIFFFGTIP
ncbi:uncharacterized protein LOC117064803 [Trachypithecus francoisi]|uniref:uncharacterized protein LOC117064803 n=1 Tax=Trachypithecus francoisi TaxID=54180 RepID=UPI00141B0705|nr:uncharacterized protein LOC117064803 [Trachypithecus francoisi]